MERLFASVTALQPPVHRTRQQARFAAGRVHHPGSSDSFDELLRLRLVV